MFATKNYISLNYQAVRCLLPHRDTMALIDGVKEYHPQDRMIMAYKRVPMNEFAMQGYLPIMPMFPGALVIEALAQASGLMMNIERLVKEGVVAERLEEPHYLTTLPEIPLSVLAESHIRQKSIATPGDTIYLEAKVAMQRAEFRYFKVTARTELTLVADGTILLSYPTYM
ncbi:MAG: hypothetical protein IT423_10760 [Pirellulaceae bacterium]|nr:hypothetical protein [Pirellulaceae bacterium]